MRLETRYARSGDAHIAYQVLGPTGGRAGLDLVFVMGWVSHLDYFWAEPGFARFLRRLAAFSRLILFDKRGTGLSDRVALADLPTLEQRMDDVRAVLDAVGSARAALVGVSEGAALCTLFAAAYPERTVALVTIGGYARRLWAPDYPWGDRPEEQRRFQERVDRAWPIDEALEERAPSRARDPRFREWWATYLRMSASPGAAVALSRMNSEVDTRRVLPSIRVPALVLHRTGDRSLPVEGSRYLAAHIPGARYVELPGEDHLPFVGDQDALLDEVEQFLTGARPAPEPHRVLLTVAAVEAVETAPTAARLGAAGWRGAVEAHGARVRQELARYRGKQIRTTGAGFLATFDGPARAVRCASAVVGAAAGSASPCGPVCTPASATCWTATPATSGGPPSRSPAGSSRRPAPATSWSRARSRTWWPARAWPSRGRARTASRGRPASGACSVSDRGRGRAPAARPLRLVVPRSRPPRPTRPPVGRGRAGDRPA